MSAPDPVRDRLRALGAPEHVVEGGLDVLLDRWEEFATDVENGYELGLEDYRNELDGRTLIHRALSAVPPRARVRDRLRKADVRVKKHVRLQEHCVWGARAARDNDWTARSHWWLFAVPKECDDELADELRRVK